ncbi:hypothetical protein EVAR_92307_1 [Eumeta japonica]|uniref:Uncharacterized protein n=1 Tax=Eumeta variegata TaxID=151549 RepID=A0A4C2ABJ9_EUMVA|nr:hypothetical protein EVAR_92307_1 [Eumeta japonica]
MNLMSDDDHGDDVDNFEEVMTDASNNSSRSVAWTYFKRDTRNNKSYLQSLLKYSLYQQQDPLIWWREEKSVSTIISDGEKISRDSVHLPRVKDYFPLLVILSQIKGRHHRIRVCNERATLYVTHALLKTCTATSSNTTDQGVQDCKHGGSTGLGRRLPVHIEVIAAGRTDRERDGAEVRRSGGISDWVEPDYQTTQLLTGHYCFRKRLHELGLNDTSMCLCEQKDEDMDRRTSEVGKTVGVCIWMVPERCLDSMEDYKLSSKARFRAKWSHCVIQREALEAKNITIEQYYDG